MVQQPTNLSDQLRGEIEITTAMIDAGYEALCMFDSDRGDVIETAVRVYTAMEAARQSGFSIS